MHTTDAAAWFSARMHAHRYRKRPYNASSWRIFGRLKSRFMISFSPMNPLLSPNLVDDFNHIPFPEIKEEHYAPALEEGIRLAKENLARIASDTSTPDFANTIESIEFMKETLDKVSGIFFNQLSANTSEFLQNLAKEFSPKLAEFSNDLLLNDKIFARVKAVYDKKDSLHLNQEQKQLLEKTYKAFRRNGALLNNTQKEKLREIDKRMSVLTQNFSDNALKATNSYVLFVENFDAIKDLPKNSLEDAKATAKEKGKENAWAFTLQYPSYFPFMQYCTDEKLRHELWKANMGKCMTGETNNQEIAKEIAKLRHERANLLGYKTHADFVLEERMATNPQRVHSFLQDLLQYSKPAGEKDFAELKAAKKAHTGSDDLKPWDVPFYSDRLKKEKYSLSDEELRPYFRLENVIAGVFEHAKRLYGLELTENKKIPVYHPDVKAYEVKDSSSKKLMGYFYADFFPRASKRGGAWMTNYLEQGTWNGKKMRPHVGIVCNFTKPTATQPSLLTLGEVRTLFHEFGHALHSLLTDCQYATIAGTNVYWDFVELPSQIMENWSTEEESLGFYATHYENGKPMPKELIEKIKKSAQFQAGMMSVRQIGLGLIDMAWHSEDPSNVKDVEEFEKKAISQTSFFPFYPGTSTSTSFSHIFAGGYSSGYYSYKWAEVLDADAFEYFKEKGIFSEEVAKKFREHVLSRGGSEHPMELYKRFRGREPDAKALLRRDGLIKE